jgi:hypothetical protein
MEDQEVRKLWAKLRGWRTVIVGAAVGLPLALLQILEALQFVDLREVLPEPWGSRIALAVTIAMVLLRLITSGPIGAKEDE